MRPDRNHWFPFQCGLPELTPMRARLVAILKWVWRRKLLVAGLCLLGLIGLVAAFHETSTPRFCGSCHEMGYEFRTWRASSHGSISCEHCHYHPGVVGMIRTKLGGLQEAAVHFRDRPTESEIGPGMAEVPSARCLACHKRRELPDKFSYHLLVITHREHLERGAQCTDCHANLVHGGKAPFKNTPTMSSCLVCHDGERAPNRCGLCHQELGEVRPALYNPRWVERHRENLATTGADVCRRCHGEDFCRTCHAITRPHPADWVRQHQQMKPEDRKRCTTCHETRGRRVEADFCTQCHEARRAHGTDFLAEHPKEFQKEPDACAQCHKETFCADCHAIYMPHGTGWLAEHPQAAREKRDSCRTCHEDRFCQSCHTSGPPKSHTPVWIETHPAMAKLDPDGCRVCHPTNYCQRCHQKSPPASHKAATWIRAHGGTALADRNSCRACHDSGYCAACHEGVVMPHPKGWLRTHPRSAINEKACRTCHAAEFCNTCHRGSKPASHDSQWNRTHGRQAARSRTSCEKCHGQQYCIVCHRVPMPHPKDVQQTHKQMALGKDGRYCGLCHTTEQCSACHEGHPPASHSEKAWPETHGASEGADGRCALCHEAATCDTCHGLPMPHPDDWLLGRHGTVAGERPDACRRCHGPDHCKACHQSAPPASHEAKDWSKTHGAQKDKEPFCALCHGRNEKAKWDACQTCHRGIVMPHPDGYALEHKEEASFQSDGPCLACHEVDYCKLCHADAPTQAE